MDARNAVVALSLILLLPAPGSSAQQEPKRRASVPNIPLRNWVPAAAAHPPSVEAGVITRMALPSSASHFVAVNPCRVVDTRRPDGPQGGPIMSGGDGYSGSVAANVNSGGRWRILSLYIGN